MFGNCNTDGIPRLNTYAEASQWESRVKPIRGRKEECKPLGDRKRSQYSIRKDGESIKVRVYNTDIITYVPNGDILLDTGGWSTITTHTIMSAVLG